MGRNLDPKCKQCRRAGERLFLKGERCSLPKCAIVKRNYPPGFHGSRRSKRLTDYGQQLQEKQKVKRQYNLLEKQFKLTFERAKKKRGNTGDIFLELLETRFDNAIFRLGLASSRSQARQLINHGHFSVNNHRVSIPSYNLKIGDTIKIRSNKQGAKIFSKLPETMKNKEIPGWMNFDKKEMSAKVLSKPDQDSIATNFNMQMIIEYYSR